MGEALWTALPETPRPTASAAGTSTAVATPATRVETTAAAAASAAAAAAAAAAASVISPSSPGSATTIGSAMTIAGSAALPLAGQVLRADSRRRETKSGKAGLGMAKGAPGRALKRSKSRRLEDAFENASTLLNCAL
jgi:hypothetical protein